MNMSDIPEMSPYLRLKVAQEVFKKAPSSLSPEERRASRRLSCARCRLNSASSRRPKRPT